MNNWIKKLVVAVALILMTGNAWSVHYFVDSVDGSDANDGSFGSFWATLHHAVDQAAAGDTILVLDGTYTLPSTLEISKEISLGGINSTGVTIDASGYGAGYGIKVEASNVELFDFILLPPASDYPIHATFNSVADPDEPHANLFLENITIENSSRTAFDIHGYDGVVLLDLTANGSTSGNGIQVTGCTDVTITGCSASGNAWGGLAFYASKSTYLNRACSNITYDMSANTISDVYVEDEFGLVNTVTVDGATYQIDNNYLVDAAMHRYTAADATTAVAIADALNDKYTNLGSAITDVVTGDLMVTETLSIQAAIDTATAGDTIIVAGGTYAEQLVITKDLTLTGDAGAILTAPAAPLATVDASGMTCESIVYADGCTVTISGFDVDGGNSATTIFAGILLNSATGEVSNITLYNLAAASGNPKTHGIMARGDSDLVIRDNMVSDHSRGGIYVYGPATASVNHNTVVGAGLLPDGAWAQNGIVALYGAAGEIVSNTVSNVRCGNPDWSTTAILVYDAADGYIVRDNIIDGAQLGIGMYLTADAEVTGNEITDTLDLSDTGIELYQADGVVVEDNSISGAAGAGIASIETAPASVINNTFAGNGSNFSVDMVAVDDSFTGAEEGFGFTKFATVQDGVNAATVGGTVTVADGTYAEQLVITKDLTLTGDAGATLTAPAAPLATVDASGMTCESIVYADGCTVTISGFEVDGGDSATTIFAGILLNSATGEVSNLTLFNLGAASGNPKTHGIMARGDSDLVIRDNTVSDHSRGGIYVYGPATASVNHNTVIGAGLLPDGDWAQNGIVALYGAAGEIVSNTVSNVRCGNPDWSTTAILVYDAADGYIVRDNIIDGAQLGIGMYLTADAEVTGNVITDTLDLSDTGIELYQADGVVVEDNSISGAAGAGIASIETAPASVINNTFANNGSDFSVDMVAVDDSFTGAEEGFGFTKFTTVQDGVNAAAGDGTVTVADGTYNENISIDKPITLVSVNGKDAVTIIGTSVAGLLGTIHISSSDVSIGTSAADGFTVVGYDVLNPGIEHAAIYLQGEVSNVSIFGNHIIAAGELGLDSEYGFACNNIEIAFNEFSGQTYVGMTVAVGDYATTWNIPRPLVYFGGPSKTDIHFHDNLVNGSVGAQIDGQPLGTEYYNSAITIDCKGATDIASGALIEDNVFDVASPKALRARGYFSTIQNNTFLNTPEGMAGVYVEQTDDDVYAGNTFDVGMGLEDDGLLVLPGSTVVIDGSSEDYTYNLLTSGILEVTWSGGIMSFAATTGTLDYNDTDLDIATVLASAPTHYYVPGDFATIQEAVAAASDGDSIFVAAGSYASASTIVIDKELTIIGDGSGDVELDLSACGQSWGLYITADNVTVEGMTLLPPLADPANLGTDSGGGFTIHAVPASPVPGGDMLQNLVLRDIVVDGANRTPFDLHGVDGALLENLVASNSAYGNGIQTTGCFDITIVGCTTADNTWGGVAFYASNLMKIGSSNITFDIDSNTIGEYVYSQDEFGFTNSVDVIGATYRIDNTDYSIFTDQNAAYAAQIAASLNASLGNTLSTVVSASGSWVVAPGMSIIAAVDSAPAGATIEVATGTYTETGQMVIDKDITIVGAGASEVLILPVYTSGTGYYTADNGWITVSEGVAFNLSGVTIDGAGQTIKMAIISRGTTVVDGCVIQNISSHIYLGWGVCILNGTESVVSNSEFYGIQRIGVHVRGQVVTPAPEAVIENCLFVGDGAIDAVQYGVEFGGGGSGLVIGCTMSNYLAVASSDGSASAGILATDYYGNGTDATIISNAISGCSSAIYAGYASNDLTTVVAQYNDLSDNEVAVQATENVTVDATLNYFGDDPDLGTLIAGPAAFDPWWADAAMTQLHTLTLYVDGAFDDSTPGWGLNHFATLQSAIVGAGSGATINVAAGTYSESGQIVVDRDLTIIGAGAGAVTLLPVYTSGGGSYDPLNGWIAVSEGVEFNLSGVTIDGAGQTIKMAIISRGTTVVDSCVIQNISSHIYLGWGVCILNGTNSVVSNSEFYGIQRIGVHVRGQVVTPAPEAVIENCLFVGDGAIDAVQYGVEFGAGGSGLVIGCTMSNYLAIASSDGSTSAGILATDYYGNGTDATIISNVITGCSSAIYAGYASIDLTTVVAHYNNLSGNEVAVQATELVTADATLNYWGEVDPDFDALVSGPASFSPWWEDAAMTILRYGDTQFPDDLLIASGESFHVYGDATIGGGGSTPTWTVDNGTLEIDGHLNLEDGAELIVRDGTLVLNTVDGTTTISGSFTIFDSWGSVYFNGDTVLAGDTLALVSHLVFADGVTLTVSGSLVLDGCVLEGAVDGDTYAVEVMDTATLQMARNEVFDSSSFTVDTADAQLKDNFFANGLTMESNASGAEVFHNVFADLGNLVTNAAGVVLEADGWGNVSTNETTLNNLGLVLNGADANGDIFIQPGDVVSMAMDVDSLNEGVAGCDALLGFNTRYFGTSGTSTEGDFPWSEQLYENWDVAGDGFYGQYDSSIGISLTGPTEGTLTDATVVLLDFTSTSEEGVTKLFFRPAEAGSLPADTALVTAGVDLPVLLSPFTMNSGYITIDGTVPLTESFMGFQDQNGVDVDVFDPAVVTEKGVVLIAIDASDDRSGLAMPSLTLVHQDDVGITLVPTLISSITNGALSASYSWAVVVDAVTSNGVYDVETIVVDRSGNATTNAATIEVNKDALDLSIELTGVTTSAFFRDVTLVMTDASGAVIESWVETLEFVNRSATLPLTQIPAGVAAISAKTDWTLRRKQVLTFVDGQATASFALLGGDITGDNVISLPDYSRLQFYFNQTTSEADITGDGVVNILDYNHIQINWFTFGDPE